MPVTEEDDDFGEEACLAEMLMDHCTLFIGSGHGTPFFDVEGDKAACAIFVNCNDLFAWGCADAEPLPQSEIIAVWRAWKADQRHGTSKWACIRRGMRPQLPVIELMKKAGSWDATMESLPAAPPS